MIFLPKWAKNGARYSLLIFFGIWQSIRNTTEFERDVLLMLTNSLIYNKEGTEVYQMALEMLEDVQEQIRVFKTADAYSSSSNVPKDTSHGLRRRSIVSDGGSIQGDADTA